MKQMSGRKHDGMNGLASVSELDELRILRGEIIKQRLTGPIGIVNRETSSYSPRADLFYELY